MAGPFDVPLTSNLRRAGTTNFDDDFGGSSTHSESTHISSVGTATEAARYFDPAGSAGTVDAVDGYPHSHPTQVDMPVAPPNSMIQGYSSLSGEGYDSFSPYHAGGPPERSQEQSQGHNHGPRTVSDEQTLSYWNGWSGDGDDSNIGGGWSCRWTD
ncbi:hypothetical protein AAF712_012482 [Marasmius tenuissimus]|uniref:Uncharacterized protein n=1 Tax=Marasmius tenuissimus TaxID=585030 RepID=A0ABR2ZJS5_9AGAR